MKTWLENEHIPFVENVSLKEYTTLHIGGRCRLLIEPKEEGQIRNVIRKLNEEGRSYVILGRGSNVLINDQKELDVVLHFLDNYNLIQQYDEERILCQCGALNSDVAAFCLEHQLSGYEFACGIPGSVGGSVLMNAGAYDGQMDQIFESCRILDDRGRIHVLHKENLDFRYRHSGIEGLILEVVFCLKKGSYASIRSKMEELTKKREAKQPLDVYSAGSTFKRPKGSYASKLIDAAGLRGFSYGDCSVSDKHTGFLINRGNGTYEQFNTLIQLVQKKVYDQFQIQLECEIKRIGGE